MDNTEPDKEADIIPVTDRQESVALMEPMVLSADSRNKHELIDIALVLTAKSASLRARLPEGVLLSLATLVRTMNCYYSNLIEGHNTHPIDIERALNNDYSSNKEKRNLQLEAKAHVAVQEWIDSGALAGKGNTRSGILEIHKRFCELLPDDLLWLENPKTNMRVRVEPAEIRTHDIEVGRHVAISAGAIPRFLERYERAYSHLGVSESLIAIAAAHHRLLWIHPFSDGNGRVARLVSYSQLLDQLNTGGVWSIARGLARNVSDYKRHLMACDAGRWNDLDGRGNLSSAALFEFSKFFLLTCLDQVEFMESLVQPDHLRGRILAWCKREIKNGRQSHNAIAIVESVLYRGEIPRADVASTLGLGERQARRIVSSLADRGVLVSATDRSPLRLAFPASLAAEWMPGLFPELQS